MLEQQYFLEISQISQMMITHLMKTSSYQIELKSDGLQSHLSQLIAQTVVFCFYQKKLNQHLTFVPSIAVNRNHIQFHFYDSENDVYLVSQEMPLFVNQTLHLSTVLATWLVLNHRYLLSDAT